MLQTPEAEAFLNRILALPKGPGVSLDSALQPSLDDEAELRRLFATDKTNKRLADPLIGLVDVFHAPKDIRTTRARVVKDEQDLSSKYVMPLPEDSRRKEGTPSMVADLEEFQKNWTVFTEGSLSQLLDWNNVVAAGGAVLACLSPLTDATKESKRSIRKYYHSVAYPTSDVDLFLWGMDIEQAEKKIIQIYEAVRDSVPWDVTCVRTKHTVSIHSQYPYRSIQIVLRLYSSPAEILAGFDIDAPCCLYNGRRVLANPRAIVAMMRQANTVDMTRRSPSYEVRLSKYSRRAFEVHISTLQRDAIDPTIYERSIARIEGLARLLVLEKLTDSNVRRDFLESRRNLRGRPNPLHQFLRRKSKYMGDLKADTSLTGLEMNDYDVATLHIPYGPGWTARRIDKLIYQTDLGMNSTFNPKNKDRRLHRHPAFFGTMEECIEDCCEHCPEPIDEDERKLQEEEDANYIRGRISFIEADPGRQSLSGSFNPIDVGEWSAQVYVGENENFFAAIVAEDRETVTEMIKNDFDVNRRDHVGRTALHVAIIARSVDIACDLIDAGARMTARLVDGRSALHLAAQYDLPVVIRKLFEKSKSNKEVSLLEEKMDVDPPVAPERPSSEDDWTSEDDTFGVVAMETDQENDGDDEDGSDIDMDKGEDKDKGSTEDQPKKHEAQEFPEDTTDQPDILEVNAADWDLGFTPLAHAVLSSSLDSVEELLKEGADVTLVNVTRDQALHPLTLTILRDDKDEAARILKRLISAGASTSTADENLRTIFHRAVAADNVELVSAILKHDPNAQSVLNFPSFGYQAIIHPIVTAIDKRHYSMLATLLAHGASLTFNEDNINDALHSFSSKKVNTFFGYGSNNPFSTVFFPLETAISKYDDVAQLLLSLDVEFNIGLRDSRGYADSSRRRTILDWVQFGIASLTKTIASRKGITPSAVEKAPEMDWKKFYADLTKENAASDVAQMERQNEEYQRECAAQEYLVDIERLLLARGAKSWGEIYPDAPSTALIEVAENHISVQPPESPTQYLLLHPHYYRSEPVAVTFVARYNELYEACFAGDNEKIEQLCLPKGEAEGQIVPLNIFVQISHKSNPSSITGHTPLFAAVCGRQWATAKLIMAIAVAQYNPPQNTNEFSTKGVVLYDVDDDGSEASDDSDVTAAPPEEVTFFDIAKRPSSIQTEIHPKRILHEAKVTWSVKGADGTSTNLSGNLLHKSIHDDDLEAFVNIFSLYTASPVAIPLDDSILESIVRKDRVEMLNNYISKTGRGVEIKLDHVDPIVMAINDKNKLYLGLTVHGKKRADLAKKNDPDAVPTTTSHPLLWLAARYGAKSIVEYLSGDRPLAAYRHYTMMGGDDRAYKMRRVNNLEKVLPEWLGWTITNLGDSPLMAALMGLDFDLLKMLFTKKPKFMASCLHVLTKFTGHNAVLLAAEIGCKPAVMDYLLAKSVSPAMNDSVRGWNVYHILCRKGHFDLTEHLLKKLPRDVNEALLIQQSKGRLNTPLHLAVKTGAKGIVSLLVEYTKTALLMRDVDGSTPLHCAVKREYAGIAHAIISAAPSEALYMENGVGDTPLDMVTLQHTLMIARSFVSEQHINASQLYVNHVFCRSRRVDLNGLEAELQRLRRTIEELERDGELVEGAPLAVELSRFADLMEEKVVAEQALEDAKSVAVEKNPNQRDVEDTERTLEVVAMAMVAKPGRRQLVHLIDVQKSVQTNLSKFAGQQQAREAFDDGEGLGVEDDEESKQRNESLVMSCISEAVRADYH